MTSFDRLTKELADTSLSRRSGLKLAFAGAATAALSALGVAGAAAAPDSPDKSICGKGCKSFHGICNGNPCAKCSNSNCFCFAVGKSTSKTACGCNFFCNSTGIKTCTSNGQCGKGKFCSQTCCSTTQYCVTKCNSTCVLAIGASDGSGKLAA